LPKIYGETDRLVLRALEKNELPRLVELIGVWDVARWLAVLPYPYTMQNAEEFYSDMENAKACGDPQFYAIAAKTDGLLIGGVGLHPPRGKNAVEGEVEIGYWLGNVYWGRGFMTEAARAVVAMSFARPATNFVAATTALDNVASQNVLCKLGLRNLGPVTRDYPALRGEDRVVKWQMTRKEWRP
jgi:8-oxo-dGTP diphosphatase